MTCDDCWRSHSLGTLSGDLLQLHEPSAAVDPPCDPLAERESDRTEDFKNVGVMMIMMTMILTASYFGYPWISSDI